MGLNLYMLQISNANEAHDRSTQPRNSLNVHSPSYNCEILERAFVNNGSI